MDWLEVSCDCGQCQGEVRPCDCSPISCGSPPPLLITGLQPLIHLQGDDTHGLVGGGELCGKAGL